MLLKGIATSTYMFIRLEHPQLLESMLDRLERLRLWVLWCVLVAAAIELGFAIFSWRWLSVASRLLLLAMISLVGVLFHELRKRNSLRWRASQFARTIRQPDVINVQSTFKDIIEFKNFISVGLAWTLIAVVVFPYNVDYSRHPIIGLSRKVFQSATPESIANLWEVHATILGFFLVLLTFVFQFVSLKMAYETSLLPFLARRARLKPIITINFGFVFIEAIAVLTGPAHVAQIELRYVSALGLMFAVVSAIFLLYRVTELLEPGTLEEGLTDLVRRDLQNQLEAEQFSALAAHLLSEECLAQGIEYSDIDFFRPTASITSDTTGIIRDFRFDRLRLFTKSLRGQLTLSGELPKKALIVRGLGDEVSSARTILARVSAEDLSPKTTALLRRSIKVSET